MSPGVGGTSSLAGLPAVWHPDCLRHHPDGEVWLGVWEAGTEVPERALVIRDALAAAGAQITTATAHDDAAILAVHDASLVEHLATIWDDWEGVGLPSEHARPGWCRTCSPPPGCCPACRCARRVPFTGGWGDSATTR